MEAAIVLLISEIMYNPASKEDVPNLVEWVEVYNPGDAAVDLSGLRLADEDGQTEAIPTGTTLEPGAAVVLIPADQSVEEFRKAWGDGVAVVALPGWGKPGLTGLGNNPSDKNEVLKLIDAGGRVIDEVNFDDEGDWPTDDPQGPSIYLKPDALTATGNDEGKNWARSEAGKDGAKRCTKTDTFNGEDVGSPGHVEK